MTVLTKDISWVDLTAYQNLEWLPPEPTLASAAFQFMMV